MEIDVVLPIIGTANINDLYALVADRYFKSIESGDSSLEQAEEDALEQFAEAVARVFIKLRINIGIDSYDTFAHKYKFPRSQYWRVENGKSNLTLRTLAKLLAIHGLNLSEFIALVFAELQHVGNGSHSIGSVKESLILERAT